MSKKIADNIVNKLGKINDPKYKSLIDMSNGKFGYLPLYTKFK